MLGNKTARPHFFITGTDTGVGKTVVCAALARCLADGGKTVSMIKPFQTGCSANEVADADFVHRAMNKSYDPRISSPCRLEEPLAPMVAAELEGREVETDGILKIIEKEAEKHDAVIVEGAGGLLVPISENRFMADFALELGFGVVIVAKAGLGTINHTLLTVEAARARGIEIAGVVVCGYPNERSLCEETNLFFLRRARQCEKVVGVVPFIQDLNVEKGEAGALIREDCRRFFTSELGGLLDGKEPPAGQQFDTRFKRVRV